MKKVLLEKKVSRINIICQRKRNLEIKSRVFFQINFLHFIRKNRVSKFEDKKHNIKSYVKKEVKSI